MLVTTFYQPFPKFRGQGRSTVFFFGLFFVSSLLLPSFLPFLLFVSAFCVPCLFLFSSTSSFSSFSVFFLKARRRRKKRKTGGHFFLIGNQPFTGKILIGHLIHQSHTNFFTSARVRNGISHRRGRSRKQKMCCIWPSCRGSVAREACVPTRRGRTCTPCRSRTCGCA